MGNVRVPAKALDDGGDDILAPTSDLLVGLSLLPNETDRQAAKGTLGTTFGTPDSIAVIEAGATALSKLWATGLAATVVGAWGSVRLFYGGQPPANQRMLIVGAAIATAAALLGISYIVSSDVRGRAAASVPTIQARSAVAHVMVEAAERAYSPAVASSSAATTPLPSPLAVHNSAKPSADEDGWKALAVKEEDGLISFLLVKADAHEWVPSAHVVVA